VRNNKCRHETLFLSTSSSCFVLPHFPLSSRPLSPLPLCSLPSRGGRGGWWGVGGSPAQIQQASLWERCNPPSGSWWNPTDKQVFCVHSELKVTLLVIVLLHQFSDHCDSYWLCHRPVCSFSAKNWRCVVPCRPTSSPVIGLFRSKNVLRVLFVQRWVVLVITVRERWRTKEAWRCDVWIRHKLFVTNYCT